MLLARRLTASGRVPLPTVRSDTLLLAGLIAAILLLFQQGSVVNSDGDSMEAVAHSIVTQRTLEVSASEGVGGRDGRHFSRYGIAMSVVAVPSVALGRAVGAVVGNADATERFFVASLEPLIVGALAAALYALARRMGAARRAGLIMACGAVLGTYALPYGKDFFSEPLTTLGIVFALERLLARRPLHAGVALAIAILARPQTLVIGALFAVILIIARRWRDGTLTGAGVVAAGAVTAAYDFYRFGSPTNTGYGGYGFTTPLLTGLHGLFLEPSKSVLLFAPIVILAPLGLSSLWRRDRVLAVLITANAMVTLLMTALWVSWEGGWSWGPRLLLPGILPLLPPIAITASKGVVRAAVGLFALGFVASGATLLVPAQAQQLDQPPPSVGPNIIRQVELIPSKVSYTRDHAFEAQAIGTGTHRLYLALWDVELTRQLGRKGLLLDSVGNLVLIVGVAQLLSRLRPFAKVDESSRQEAAF